jgi:DNA-directed RNA polymerase specialized sigma24 family protein
MHSPTFEDVFPIVRELARQKARTVIGRCGLTTADREDIEAHLLSTLYIRFPKFNSKRASVLTFASRIMDKELISIMRYRLASRRRPSFLPALLQEFDNDDAGISINKRPSPVERCEFWVDVNRALAPLPDVLRETALALCWSSPTELSRTLGQSRTSIYARIRRLRNTFNSAGIGPAYFASFGGGR